MPAKPQLPGPPPQHTANADKFHALSKELFDKYVEAIGNDLDELAKRVGDVDPTFAHNDLTRILVQQIPNGSLAGLAAYGILQGVSGKVRFKR